MIRARIALAAALLATASPVLAADKPDTLFQYSTINALLAGLYEGDMAFGELVRHGDTGIGTFNGVDGELVVLDGRVYQVKADGNAYAVAPEAVTPFAVVTHFDADKTAELPAGLSLADLQKHLDTLVSSPNQFQAFRVDGTFRALKVRSVPAQQPPYRPLAEVIAQQSVYDYQDVAGTLIGFRTPNYVPGLNVPGYHFHFLTQDRGRGGHVLDLVTGDATAVRIDEIAGFEMALPGRADFAATDLTGARKEELKKVEQGK